MILTLRNIIKYKYVALLLVGLIVPSGLHAQQEGISISVSPTLFEMTAEPGRTWQSTLRIINTNRFPLELSAEVVNFEARNENGTSSFVPLVGDVADATTLAGWITLSDTSIVVPPEQTLALPITITVPENAPPGGHYAAVLVGTDIRRTEGGGSAVATAQKVSSLLFLRVAGDVEESAQVRSFRSTDAVLSRPETTFELRIQNTGNVHVQPQGDIYIYNMWGQERGVIPVNRRNMFGNVLPDTVRKYTFSWIGEWSVTDLGRYRAEAVLAYGSTNRKSLTVETYFWVIPWKPLLSIIAVLGVFIWLLSWAIKSYVRRMLALAGVDPHRTPLMPPENATVITKAKRRPSITAPFETGLLDLRSHLSQGKNWVERATRFGQLLYRHRQPLVGVFLLIVGLGLIIWFVAGATSDNRDYEVTIGEAGRATRLTRDDIESVSDTSSAEQSGLPVVVVNRSGVVGAASRATEILQQAGYIVSDVRTDAEARDDRTVIVYDPELSSDAVALSELFGSAPLSAYRPTESETDRIVIYLGTDQIE